MTWITTSPFWNTQFQRVTPSTRTEVSSESITPGATQPRQNGGDIGIEPRHAERRNAASSAPSLIRKA